jgi:hypothetical protein
VVDAAAEFDNVELLRYESLSHFGPLEDPDGLATDVIDWLIRSGQPGG